MFCDGLAMPLLERPEMQHWKDFRSLSRTVGILYAMNVRILAVFFVFSFLTSLELANGDPATITEEELVRCTQELFDAVLPGNKQPWQKYFAEDCIFADEKGRTLNKTQLMADISPLPKGYSGSIKVVKPQSIIRGDTAILSYELDEAE